MLRWWTPFLTWLMAAAAAYESAMAMTEHDPRGSNKVRLAMANFRLFVGNTSAALEAIEGCKARGYETAGVRMLEAEALMRLDRVAEAETALRWVLDGVATALVRGTLTPNQASLSIDLLPCSIHSAVCVLRGWLPEANRSWLRR
jgi:hypothetical protein